MLEERKEEFGKIKVLLYDCIEYPASTHPKKNAVYGNVRSEF